MIHGSHTPWTVKVDSVGAGLLVYWCFRCKMQIIVKNQNGNGLISGIPQRDLDRES